MSGTIRTNSASDMNMVVTFDNLIFTNANITEFSFVNKINSIPSGELSIIDNNANFIRIKSSDFGTIFFTNTSDNATEKISSLDIFITEIFTDEEVAPNVVYRIKWIAGNLDQLKKSTFAFQGISTETISEIYNLTSSRNAFFPPSATKPNDNMTWRFVQENMWEKLDTVIKKSYLKDDYLFWAWDDVNDKFKISSLKTESDLSDRYILIETPDAVGSTDTNKLVMNSPNFTVWGFDKNRTVNDLGNWKNFLFPNVAFSGIVGTDLKSAEFKKINFSQMLDLMGDTKQKEILENTGLTENTAVFGDLKVRRYWPNNVHTMYTFSDIYRDYKISTFGKVIYVQIYNNVGPPMGSKVTVLKSGSGYRVKGFSVDENFSDFYMVDTKRIEYNTVNETIGGVRSTNSNFITTIKLISDNFVLNESLEHLKSISKQLKENR